MLVGAVTGALSCSWPDLHHPCSPSPRPRPYVQAFFVGLAVLGVIIGVFLNLDDTRNRNKQPNKVRRKGSSDESIN